VGCISGCLFAIRRELLLEIEPKIRQPSLVRDTG